MCAIVFREKTGNNRKIVNFTYGCIYAFWKLLSNSYTAFNLENVNLLSNRNVNLKIGVAYKKKNVTSFYTLQNHQKTLGSLMFSVSTERKHLPEKNHVFAPFQDVYPTEIFWVWTAFTNLSIYCRQSHETYSDPSQKSEMELFAKIALRKWLKALKYFAKISILNVWQGSECASVIHLRTMFQSCRNHSIELQYKSVAWCQQSLNADIGCEVD